jgi:hypothetical protein
LSPLSNATITITASNPSEIAPTTLSTMTITCITSLVANDCQIVLPLQSPFRRLLPKELVLLQSPAFSPHRCTSIALASLGLERTAWGIALCLIPVVDRRIAAAERQIQVRPRTMLGGAAWVPTGDQGRDHPGTVQSFSRDLRAAVPGVTTVQERVSGDERQRRHEGIGLRTDVPIGVRARAEAALKPKS